VTRLTTTILLVFAATSAVPKPEGTEVKVLPHGMLYETRSAFDCTPIRSEESTVPDQDLTSHQDDGESEHFELENLVSKPTFIGDDYVLVIGVAPVYPAGALSRGLEGYVDLSFTVTSAGVVTDPVVIQSTDSVFDRAAIRTVLIYKYKPRVDDGVPVDTPNVEARISFEIEN
jgi:TonB family protein